MRCHYRISAIVALVACWAVGCVAAAPDEIDRVAAAQLAAAIRRAAIQQPEFALETAVESAPLKADITWFGDVWDEERKTRHLPLARPAGVSPAEWRALRASVKETVAADGVAHTNYGLLDLDGDGDRDLIIRSLMDGTGVWNFVDLAWQHAGRFVVWVQPDGKPLVSYSERGANQVDLWVRLQGRSYLAFRDGSHGQDRVYLVRPFVTNRKVPVITLSYRYVQIVVTDKQMRHDVWNIPELAARTTLLAQTVARLEAGTLAKWPRPGQPVCPIPEDVDPQRRDYWFGAGAISSYLDRAASFPVWIDGECYVSQLVDRFGYYSRQGGLWMELDLLQPEVEGMEGWMEFEVNARRRLHGVKTGIGRFDLIR